MNEMYNIDDKKINMKPYLYVSKVYCNQREPILFHLKKHQLQKDTTLIKPYVNPSINKISMYIGCFPVKCNF